MSTSDFELGATLKRKDGTEKMRITVEWFDLKDEQVTAIEGALIGGMGMLLEVTKEEQSAPTPAATDPGVMR